MTCPLTLPRSLADAEAIIEACAGPDWRSLFLLGTLVLLLFLAVSLSYVVWLRWRA